MNLKEIMMKLQKLGKDRFLLLFLAGLMLVIIAIPVDKMQNGKHKEVTPGTENSSENTIQNETVYGTEDSTDSGKGDIEMYRQNLCNDLKQFLEKMDGVGRTEVYITMHSTSEIIVERNSPYTRRSEEETTDGNTRSIGETENGSEVVLVEQEDGSMAPIVVKEIEPVVKGIVVAAQGGNNESVKKNITEMMMALFGIEEHKIRVVKLNT